jgi:hypothetical protein
MNLNFIIKFIKHPKSWIIFNIIISSILALSWITYKKHIEALAIEKQEKKLEKLKKQNAEINIELVRVRDFEKLPKIESQVDITQFYFESFGLDFEKQQKHKNGTYYNAVVSGSLKGLLLALKDIKVQKIPLQYKNIAIADDKAALHIIILGSK